MGHPVRVEHSLSDGGGEQRHFEIHAYPIPGPDGAVTHVLYRCVDVSDRGHAEEALRRTNDELERRVAERTAELSALNQCLRESVVRLAAAEARLRESEEWHRTLCEEHADGICVIAQGRIEQANPALARMTGVPVDELVGCDPIALLAPESRERARRKLAALLEGARGQPAEYDLDRRDGGTMPVEIMSRRIDRRDGPVVLSVLRDITERRRADGRARQHQAELAHVARLSVMGEMAANLAHELNQPLSAIANFANGIVRRIRAGEAKPGEVLDAARDVVRQADHAGAIVRRVRSFVRRREPKRGTIDLNALVLEALSFIRAEAQRHDVTVHVALSNSLPPVEADEIQIEQVLVNLALNGLEAILERGDGPRQLGVWTRPADDGWVRVGVRDSGVGLTEETARRMFEPFFTTKSAGIGMGLPISRSIIEAHGGVLCAECAADGGTEITFTLPAGGSCGHRES